MTVITKVQIVVTKLKIECMLSLLQPQVLVSIDRKHSNSGCKLMEQIINIV